MKPTLYIHWGNYKDAGMTKRPLCAYS